MVCIDVVSVGPLKMGRPHASTRIELKQIQRPRAEHGEPGFPRGALGRAMLADLTVLDLDGNAVPLHTLWAAGDTLLVWVRHFG